MTKYGSMVTRAGSAAVGEQANISTAQTESNPLLRESHLMARVLSEVGEPGQP